MANIQTPRCFIGKDYIAGDENALSYFNQQTSI